MHDFQTLFDLTGRTAVVTGGGGWLGSAMTGVLAELGANVFIASREAHEIDLPEVANKVQHVRMDMVDKASVAKCFNQVVEQTGRFDILINNAYSGKRHSIEETDDATWNETIDVGLSGYFRCIQQSIDHMKAGGGGVIVNVSSMYGLVAPYPDIYEGTDLLNPPAYGVAKAGVLQLTRYAACHLARYGVRVNSLTPGAFPSAAVREQNKEFIDRLSKRNPLGRVGEPWELKGAIAFLCSDASTYMTGQNVIVDGGWTAW